MTTFKTIIALLINLPMLIWLTLKTPSKEDLLKIIETEAEQQKSIEDMKREQSNLLSK